MLKVNFNAITNILFKFSILIIDDLRTDNFGYLPQKQNPTIDWEHILSKRRQKHNHPTSCIYHNGGYNTRYLVLHHVLFHTHLLSSKLINLSICSCAFSVTLLCAESSLMASTSASWLFTVELGPTAVLLSPV